MNGTKWKAILPYAGIPVLMLLLFLLNSKKEESVILLLQEILLFFGYVAALGDVREMRVPNRLVAAMLGVWVLVMVPQLFLRTEKTVLLMISAVIGAVLSGGLFLVVYMVSRKGLGGGDVKLMTVSGLYLGIGDVLSAMLYGSILAAAAGLILILTKKIGPRDAIPLVPFLYAGMLLAMIIQ